jgi:response regulator RpfG family c-di-GMP phosphodiesterase
MILGEIRISENIMLNPSKLNEIEMVEIRHHAEIGYNLFKDSSPSDQNGCTHR